MNSQGKLFRSGAAFVAVATAFTTTAAAAPSHAPVLDPLVAVSVFGTQSSQAAVCAAGSQAAAAAAGTAATTAAATTATTAQAAPGGCVLPVGGVAPPPAVGLGPAVAPIASSGIGILPLLLGLAAVAGLAALLLANDKRSRGDLTPVSP